MFSNAYIKDVMNKNIRHYKQVFILAKTNKNDSTIKTYKRA